MTKFIHHLVQRCLIKVQLLDSKRRNIDVNNSLKGLRIKRNELMCNLGYL